MTAHLLVVAKAPVPGYSKTRLAASVGPEQAAELAADALLDTLAAGAAAFAVGRRHVALAGDLSAGARAAELRKALADWQVRPQADGTFGQRLARAHAQVPGPVVQIGMDTPQATPDDLRVVAEQLGTADAVLGRAVDGGWWVLGLQEPRHARCLVDVPMSTAHTADATCTALVAAGLDPVETLVLQDVDTAADADAVAARHQDLAFARRWTELRWAT